MYSVRKYNKRLWIYDPDGVGIYTPPNFIRLQSREPMHALADRFNEIGARDIGAIIDFETINRRCRNYRI